MTAGVYQNDLHFPYHVVKHIPISRNCSINDLIELCRSGNRISEVKEFVRCELTRLRTEGPSFIRDFLATKESVTSDNAWTILSLFKELILLYP